MVELTETVDMKSVDKQEWLIHGTIFSSLLESQVLLVLRVGLRENCLEVSC